MLGDDTGIFQKGTCKGSQPEARAFMIMPRYANSIHQCHPSFESDLINKGPFPASFALHLIALSPLAASPL